MGHFLRSSKHRQLVIFLVLIAASATLWFGRGRVAATLDELPGAAQPSDEQAKNGSQRPVPVIITQVSERPDALSVIAVGTARAVRAVKIISEVAGEIVELNVVSGDHVGEGKTLLKLDDRKALIARNIAENKLEEAQRRLARAEQLNRRNIASIANVEDATVIVRRAELERDQAQELLDDHVIKAPFAGVVGISAVEPGDRVASMTPVMSLDDRSTLLVEFDVPEKFIGRLDADLAVEGRTPSFDDHVFKGRISNIDSRVDTVARTVNVRAAFDNADDLLRPGMSFSITLDLSGQAYPAVPELAVQWGKEGSYVWRVAEGRERKVPVRLVRRRRGEVLVDAALKPGDAVVVEGVQRLRDGRLVAFASSGPQPDIVPDATLAREDGVVVM